MDLPPPPSYEDALDMGEQAPSGYYDQQRHAYGGPQPQPFDSGFGTAHFPPYLGPGVDSQTPFGETDLPPSLDSGPRACLPSSSSGEKEKAAAPKAKKPSEMTVGEQMDYVNQQMRNLREAHKEEKPAAVPNAKKVSEKTMAEQMDIINGAMKNYREKERETPAATPKVKPASEMTMKEKMDYINKTTRDYNAEKKKEPPAVKEKKPSEMTMQEKMDYINKQMKRLT